MCRVLGSKPHALTHMPCPSGVFYRHPEQPLGAGEWRKAAEIGLKCKNTSLKMHFYYMDKMKNSISSKNPLFMYENHLELEKNNMNFYRLLSY